MEWLVRMEWEGKIIIKRQGEEKRGGGREWEKGKENKIQKGNEE